MRGLSSPPTPHHHTERPDLSSYLSAPPLPAPDTMCLSPPVSLLLPHPTPTPVTAQAAWFKWNFPEKPPNSLLSTLFLPIPNTFNLLCLLSADQHLRLPLLYFLCPLSV